MDDETVNIDPSLRLRYLLVPTVLGSVRVKRHLTILIARVLDEESSNRLAHVQLARWYCDDIRDDIDLDVRLVVPENATTTRAVFERSAVSHSVIAAIDEADVGSISKTALELDADVVLVADAEALRSFLIDDVMLVVDTVEDILHNVEIHLKGFDVPWSFEFPGKLQPWTNFYSLCERSIFAALETEWRNSAACGPDVENKMRILVGHTLPAMCFNRDRMEFFRQQDRWTDRREIERQGFRFEYTNALNNFYVTMYSAVDLVAAICVDVFGLEIPKEQIYAISGQFPKKRTAVPGLHEVFTDKAFWDMYKLPRLIRHEAVHSGPVTPQTVYTGEDDFTDDQIDDAAHKHGLYDDLRILEKHGPLPHAVRNDIINMARFKARLKLLGRPIKHGVLLFDGKKTLIYNPDPASALKGFNAFFDRVLAIIKPWGALRPKLTWPVAPKV